MYLSKTPKYRGYKMGCPEGWVRHVSVTQTTTRRDQSIGSTDVNNSHDTLIAKTWYIQPSFAQYFSSSIQGIISNSEVLKLIMFPLLTGVNVSKMICTSCRTNVTDTKWGFESPTLRLRLQRLVREVTTETARANEFSARVTNNSTLLVSFGCIL